MMVKPRDGGVVLTFEPDEVDYLRSEVGHAIARLDGGVPEHGADPVRDRLFPRAYVDPTEDRAEQDFQSVVHEDLVLAKSVGLDAIGTALDGGRERRGRTEVVVGAAELESWIGGLNDVRLVLGTTLGVTEDDDGEDGDGEDGAWEVGGGEDDAGGGRGRHPVSIERAGYDWLTEVQGVLLAVLMGEA
jgi:hypothetical protein